MTSRSYHIPFAQRGTSLTVINPWVTAGTDTSADLYAYDSGRYYINHVESLIENVITGTETLKYLGKTEESINLLNFETQQLTVEVEPQLNNFYKLVYIIVRNETSVPASGTPDFFERFAPASVDGNKYTFDINKVLRVNSVASGFIFGIEHRQNVLDGTVQDELLSNPLDKQIFKITIDGTSILNSVYDISAAGEIVHREYRKRLYIRDPSSEIGFLAYDKITEKYNYNDGTDDHTVYRFNIVDSVLHNVTISGNDANNNTFVKNLRIKSGTVQLNVNTTTPGYVLDFAEVELAPETLASVPDGNSKLTITKTSA
jgi:hypothetical protein